MSLSLQSRLEQKKLSALKENLVSGIWADQDHKKKRDQVQKLLENALFLHDDQERKKRWIMVLNELDISALDQLAQAIIRENFRFKKQQRDLVIELNKKVPVSSSVHS